MKIFTIQPYEIADNWGWIESFLERVEEPVWGVDDVRSALENCEAQLWGFGEDGKPLGIVVTRLGKIGETPSGLVWLAAGDRIECFVDVLRNYIEPWMREKGCKVVEINGRRGWKKILPDYTERTTVFARKLDH